MVMKTLRDGASGGVTKFILFGFLVMAVGGLVMMDVGGFFRGGVASTDVAKVGNKTINIASFDRNLRQTLRQLGMNTQEAYRAGYVNQALSSEVRALLIQHSAEKFGIKIPDEIVAQQISKLIAPMTLNGQSPQDVLVQILRSQGLSEGEFAGAITRDMGNRLIQNAVEGSFQEPSEQMLIDLYKYKKETRDVEFITFLDNEVKTITPPSDEELENLYNAAREAYAIDEKRTFNLVILDTSALEKSLSISDEDIKYNYDSNIDLYTTAASWTLDQALVPTKDLAMEIYEAAKGGKSLENAVKDATSASSYIGTEEYPKDGLLEQLRDTIIANTQKNKLLEPVSSPLGWHIIRVKNINPERVRPLNEVKAEIKKDMIEEQIIDQQYELANNVDDMLAGGATIEEVSEEIPLNIVPLPAVNQFGLNADGKDALKDYTDIRQNILETGFTLNEGETSAIFESADGRFMAVYLDKLSPKFYTPFEDIKNDLSKQWIADQSRMNNKLRLAKLMKKVKDEELTLAKAAREEGKTIKKKNDIGRIAKNGDILPARAVDNLFEAPIGTPILIDVKGGAALAVVTDYAWPKVNVAKKDFETFKTNYMADLRHETLGLFLTKQQDKYKATINQKLLEQVYGAKDQN